MPPAARAVQAFADAAARPGALVVDVARPGRRTRRRTAKGALAIPFRDSFPTWLGWLRAGRRATAARARRRHARRRRRRVPRWSASSGSTATSRAGWSAWREAGLPGPLAPHDRCGGRGAVARRRERSRSTCASPTSWSAARSRARCRCRSAICRRRRERSRPGGPWLAYCASGLRSTTAASILERAGVGPGREPQGRVRRVAGSRPRLTSASTDPGSAATRTRR